MNALDLKYINQRSKLFYLWWSHSNNYIVSLKEVNTPFCALSTGKIFRWVAASHHILDKERHIEHLQGALYIAYYFTSIMRIEHNSLKTVLVPH